MKTYGFTLVLDRAPTDDEEDALFEAGGDDAIPERNDRTNTGRIHFDRQAPSLAEALVSALRTVEAAGLHVAGVRSDDLVTLKGGRRPYRANLRERPAAQHRSARSRRLPARDGNRRRWLQLLLLGAGRTVVRRCITVSARRDTLSP